MTTAQRLYEGVDLGAQGAVGLITYMRTDSTRVSEVAVAAAREWIGESLGAEYRASSPRHWLGKQQKGAQEAHEAIRPTSVDLHPDDVRPYLDTGEAQLYELIWVRSVSGPLRPALQVPPTM